jgi:hypothetical protein
VHYNGPIDITRGSSKAQILGRIPVHCMHVGFILHHKNGSYWHAVAIRMYKGTWYLLESMASSPVPLHAETDWHQLHGNIYAPRQGDCVAARQVNADMAAACKRYHDPGTKGSLISTLMSFPDSEAPHTNIETAPLQACMPAAPTIVERPMQVQQPQVHEIQSSKPSRKKAAQRKTKIQTGPMDAFITRMKPSPTLSEKVPVPPCLQPMTTMPAGTHKRPHSQLTLDELRAPSSPVIETTRVATSANEHTPIHLGNADNLHIMTLNCRGIRTSWDTVRLAITMQQPDIIFMTETKLISGMRFMSTMRRDEPQYTFHASSITKVAASQGPPSPAHVTRQGAAGVIVAIHNHPIQHPSSRHWHIYAIHSHQRSAYLCPARVHLQASPRHHSRMYQGRAPTHRRWGYERSPNSPRQVHGCPDHCG